MQNKWGHGRQPPPGGAAPAAVSGRPGAPRPAPRSAGPAARGSVAGQPREASMPATHSNDNSDHYTFVSSKATKRRIDCVSLEKNPRQALKGCATDNDSMPTGALEKRGGTARSRSRT